MREVYLDFAATTPVHPDVAAAVFEALRENWGNPSSIHGRGRMARRAVEAARRQVAALLGADPSEVVFTSGGTEANNLAIQGAARAAREAGRGAHVVTSAVEHHAVLDACQALAADGFECTVLPVDHTGRIDLEMVEKAIRDDTALVSVMLANNEVGTLQPVAEIARLARSRGALVHTDAVQAAGQIPIDVHALGVDLLTISAHKIYGPKGVGALFVRRGVRLAPLLRGGSQERRWRPGTENVPGIVGFGVAAELARRELPMRAAHLRQMRDRLIEAVLARVPGAELTGPTEERLPSIASFVFPGADGEALLVALDLEGVRASSGSACTSGSLEPSHVLLAMGYPREVALTAVRLSVGLSTTGDDVEFAAQALVRALQKQGVRAAHKVV